MSAQGNSKDMRLTENREGMTNIEQHPLNLDGSEDMRYKKNQQEIDTSGVKDPAGLLNIATKNDGTADMRFKEAKEAVNLGVIDRDENLTGNTGKK